MALGEEAGKRVRGMSKGMRQKVKMAQALVHDPPVLLLDEPLNGMDPPSRAQAIEAIRRWGEQGKCVLVSSHMLHEVEAMTSRILLLHHGKLLASGEVPQVREAIASQAHAHVRALRRRAVPGVGAHRLAQRARRSPSGRTARPSRRR